jgi:hypothetical protein
LSGQDLSRDPAGRRDDLFNALGQFRSREEVYFATDRDDGKGGTRTKYTDGKSIGLITHTSLAMPRTPTVWIGRLWVRSTTGRGGHLALGPIARSVLNLAAAEILCSAGQHSEGAPLAGFVPPPATRRCDLHSPLRGGIRFGYFCSTLARSPAGVGLITAS